MTARLCATVAAAAIVIAAVSGCADPVNQRSGSGIVSSPQTVGVGRLWQLVQINHAGRTVAVPSTIDATLQLTSDGQFLASDTVNATSGKYKRTASGFVVTFAATTLVGYGGSDPTRLSVIDAIRELTLSTNHVDATINGTHLTLTVAHDRLVFVDHGPAVVYPSASPTTPMNTSG
jgi:heat shock protein HslJ